MPKFLHSQTDFSSGRLGKTYKGKWNLKVYNQGCLELDNAVVSSNGGAYKVQGATLGQDLSTIPILLGQSIDAVQSYSTTINNKSYTLFIISSVSLNSLVIAFYRNGIFEAQTNLSLNGVDGEGVQLATVENKIFFAFQSGNKPPFAIEVDASSFPVGLTNLPLLAGLNNYLAAPFGNVNIRSDRSITISGASDGNPVTFPTITFNNVGRNPVVGEIIAVGGIWDSGGNTQTGLNYFYLSNPIGNTATGIPYLADNNGDTIPAIDGDYNEYYLQAWGPGNPSYPRVVSSSDGRVIYASTREQPSTIWGSAVGNTENLANVKPFVIGSGIAIGSGFSGEVVDTDPYSFTIAAKEGADIQWIRSNKELAIGTNSGLFLARAFEGIIGPTNIDIKPYNGHKTSGDSVYLNDTLYYTANNDSALVRFSYNAQNQSYSSQDVSILSPDIFNKDIKKIVANVKNNCVAVLGNGGDLKIIVDRQSSSILAFSTLSENVGVKVETLTYNFGEGVYYGVAIIDNSYYFFTIDLSFSASRSSYLDYSSQYTTAGAGEVLVPTEFTTDFDGREIYYYRVGDNDNVLLSTLNASGEFAIPASPNASDTYVYGFDKEAKISPMPIEAGNQWGSPDMSIKRVDAVQTRVIDSYSFNLKVRNSNNSAERVQVVDTYGLGDGRFRTTVDGSSEEDIIIDLTSNPIEPLFVTSMTFRGVANDG